MRNDVMNIFRLGVSFVLDMNGEATRGLCEQRA